MSLWTNANPIFSVVMLRQLSANKTGPANVSVSQTHRAHETLGAFLFRKHQVNFILWHRPVVRAVTKAGVTGVCGKRHILVNHDGGRLLHPLQLLAQLLETVIGQLTLLLVELKILKRTRNGTTELGP